MCCGVLHTACGDSGTDPTPPSSPTSNAASLAIAPTSVSLIRGDSIWLVADVETAAHARLRGQPVGWSASPSGLLTLVGSQGDSVRVVGRSTGSATVRASLGGLSATANVTVTAAPVPVASVVVTPGVDTVAAGLNVSLAAAAKSSSGATLTTPITWSSSAAAVASVDAQGHVSALTPGTATITATAGGVDGHATLVVTDIGSITLTGVPSPFRVGAHVTLGADVRTAGGTAVTGRTVSWASLTPTVATLSTDGVLTGVTEGQTLVVVSLDGFADTTVVTVSAPLGAVRVAPTIVVVPAGRSFALTVTNSDGTPAGPGDATFTTDAGAVATVSTSGVITGAGAGSTHIRVTGGGVTRVVRVEVPAAGTLAFGLSDSLLQPDSILVATAPDLSGASASVGGTAALVTGSASTVSITAPGSRWGPCLGPGRTFALALSAGGKSTTVSLAAAAKPVAMSLAVGSWAFLPEAARTSGCEVRLDAGSYGGVAFVAESLRTTFVDFQSRPMFPVRLTSRASVRAPMPSSDLQPPSFSRMAAVRRVPGPSFYAKAPVGPSVAWADAPDPAWTHVAPPSSAALAASGTCGAWPTTVGDTIAIRVYRYPQTDSYVARRGGFMAVDLNGLPSVPIEPWTLVVHTAHLSVYADTALMRAIAEDSRILGDVQAEAAGYESTVVPMQTKFGIAPPDDDGIGTVVILLSRQAFNGTYASGWPQGVGRVGCESEGTSITMPYTWRRTDEPSRAGFNVATDVEILAHEAGHLWEQPLRITTAGENRTWYIGEGTATLIEHLWATRDNWQGFNGNLAAYPASTLDGATNLLGNKCGPQAVNTGTPGVYYGGNLGTYWSSCWFQIRIGAQLEADGVPESQIMTRLVTGSTDQRTLTRYRNGVLGVNQSSEVTWATWLLSLFADGHAGMATDLTDLAWNLADPDVQPEAIRFNHLTLTPSPGNRVTWSLEDAGEIFFTVQSGSASLLGFFKNTSEAFGASDRPRLALVRLQ
jgi:hypothetical protein